MTKQMIKNIIVLGLVTLLMGGLIAGTYAITAPIIKKNENRALENVAREYFPESNVYFKIGDSLASEKFDSEVLNGLEKEKVNELKEILFVYQEDEYLGLVIVDEKSNAHGSIKLAAAINPNGLILGIKAIDFSQTPGIGDPALTKYEAEFKNVSLSHKIDHVGGATNSSNTLSDIMTNIANIYNSNQELISALTGVEVEVDPLIDIFGEHTKTLDPEFVPSAIILERYIIAGDKLSGFSYVGSKEHSFEVPGGKIVEGEVRLEVFVNEDNEVVHYNFVVYEHSPGNFQNRIIAYLDKLIGYNLSEIEQFIVDNKEVYAGSSETGGTVIDEILKGILGTLDPLKEVFGDYTKEKDSAFTPVDSILERYIFTGSLANGSSFVGSIEHSFDTGHSTVSGETKLEVILDEEGIVLAYDFLVYKHSSGGFKNRIIAYLDKLIGENILDVEAFIVNNKEIYANSSETGAVVIDEILKDVRDAYKEYHPLYKVYGNFTKTLEGSYNEDGAVIEAYNITGDKANGQSFIGSASHSFDAHGRPVEGEVKIEFYLDENGIVLAYEILVYDHTIKGFQPRIIEYLDALVGTNMNNVEQFIVDNKDIYAGSSETGSNVIDVILKGISEVLKR